MSLGAGAPAAGRGCDPGERGQSLTPQAMRSDALAEAMRVSLGAGAPAAGRGCDPGERGRMPTLRTMPRSAIIAPAGMGRLGEGRRCT